MTITTDPAAVEAMIERLKGYANHDPQTSWRSQCERDAIAMLRALAGERDEWRDKYNALAETALGHVEELGRDNGRKDVEIDAARASQKAAEAEAAALREALHDAIRRPMGVVPASAEPFYSVDEAEAAEARRIALKENHDGL